VSHKRNLRITLALGIAALAAIPAVPAQAANVCNEARNGHTGSYLATDGDPGIPARNQSGLAVLGDGKGLNIAAANSPALSVCVLPSDTGGGGGVS
jgi:hypothetical protein